MPEIEQLTPRELEVAKYWSNPFMDVKDIARLLGIEARTVTSHIGNIYGKLGVSNRSMMMVVVWNLFDPKQEIYNEAMRLAKGYNP